MGIIWALIAMLTWGLGDFLIQKSIRRLGTMSQKLASWFLMKNDDRYSTWIVLFYICGFGAITLTPFVLPEIRFLTGRDILMLLTVGIVMLVAALLDFKALKIGKISIVEPVFALEIPIVMLFTSALLGEVLSGNQYMMIAILVVAIILISVEDFSRLKKFAFERGVGLAIAATIAMGAADFLVGFGSRETSPLLTNWFLNIVVTVATFVYLAGAGKLKLTYSYAEQNKGLILGTCFLDNLAWVAYAFSMERIPIAIATAISENYIAIGSFLGFVCNKEKLAKHQWAGIVISIVVAVILATTMVE